MDGALNDGVYRRIVRGRMMLGGGGLGLVNGILSLMLGLTVLKK